MLILVAVALLGLTHLGLTVGIRLIAEKGRFAHAGVTLDGQGTPQVVTAQCPDDGGIESIEIKARDSGAVAFRADLKPGATPRTHLTVDGEQDPAYVKDVRSPLGADVVYDLSVVSTYSGDSVDSGALAFRPADLGGDDVLRYVAHDSRQDRRELEAFDRARAGCP